MKWLLLKWLLLLLGSLWTLPVPAQQAPEWFVESFLDLREDAAEAAAQGKRLMLYFMQDGCPYCRQLVTVNWRQREIVEQTRRHFMPVAINIWGDREVTLADGRRLPEKRFAAALKVQFTPTLVFFDGRGAVAYRINGYLPPEQFSAALDAAIGGAAPPPLEPAPARLDVRRKQAAKPLAILLLSPACGACEELERDLDSAELRPLVARFELVRASAPVSVVTARGARELASAYAPSIVFFVGGAEVFRTEAYLRSFHLAGAFDYVSSGSYAREPSFQRFLQARAERMRGRGERVELWN
jgi:thioredoxin-related protein